MAADDSSPQIGKLSVDADALGLPGEELEAFLRRFTVEEPDPQMLVSVPERGWRILDRPAFGGVVIGAPVDAGGTGWRIGHISPGRGTSRDRLAMYREVQALRPSRAERRGGLVLRWPETTRSEPDVDALAIDIVNTGSERWRPADDSFHIVGSLRVPGEPDPTFYYAYVGGTHPALPLDPGEYARTRVAVESSIWNDLEPGIHEVLAMLTDLGLRSEPLMVEITAETIAVRRAQLRARLERFARDAPPAPPAAT